MMYDFSPLYRSTVGFERLANLLEGAGHEEAMGNWPPYNVERAGDDAYRIVMALAGFAPEDLEVIQQENVLTITGKKEATGENAEVLHRGIRTGAFRKTFHLAQYVKVSEAKFEDGLLRVELVREVPEALKPRRIEVNSSKSDSGTHIEHSKAA